MKKKQGTLAVLAAAGILFTLTACGASGAQTASTAESTASSAAASAQAGGSITVFAAASLTESFSQIAKQFKAADNIDVKFNFGGSQQLEAAVEQGTPADVLAYASESYMKTARSKGYVSDYTVFARNTLVACKLKSSPKRIASLADLSKPGIMLIVGNDKVPCGAYFVSVLNAASITDAQKKAIRANVRSEEVNVKDVLAKVQSGNGDFGVVYATDITSNVQDQVTAVTLPEFAAAKPKYPIAVTKSSKNQEAAQKFVDYVQSDAGKSVLKSFKFIVD